MSGFAEQSTDIEVALAGAPGFSLADRFVVAGTDTDPRCQMISAAEGGHRPNRNHSAVTICEAGNSIVAAPNVTFFNLDD